MRKNNLSDVEKWEKKEEFNKFLFGDQGIVWYIFFFILFGWPMFLALFKLCL